MEKNLVRLESIDLRNFKNVKNGYLSMPKTELVNQAQILGIYGQNGSGKTAVIDALYFLKNAVLGKQLPKDAAYYIYHGEPEATLSFAWKVFNWGGDAESMLDVIYTFTISARNDEVTISAEALSFSGWMNGKRIYKTSLAETATGGECIVCPKYRLNQILVSNQDAEAEREEEIQLRLAWLLAQKEQTSFLFGEAFIPFWEKGIKGEPVWGLIPLLKNYAVANLFVIRNRDTGIINLDLGMPFVIKHEDQERLTVGDMMIRYAEPTVFDEERFQLFSLVLENLNLVLESMIPGLIIQIKNHGQQVTRDGQTGVRFELLAVRGAVSIPLLYESEGIKKIISILSLLIAMYNHPSVCVAVDELDAGIYEYLLGEMLNVIAESGKGQLLFTSHNLRPLELIHKSSIIFTTINPENRYIRFTNVKRNNNLRDLYLRSINLGGLNESVYEPTKDYEIRRAFRKAGGVLNEESGSISSGGNN